MVLLYMGCSKITTFFSCTCAAGFVGRNCDENVNECESNPCFNGECLDLVDSYKCLCPPTYLGDHCEEGMVNIAYLTRELEYTLTCKALF